MPPCFTQVLEPVTVIETIHSVPTPMADSRPSTDDRLSVSLGDTLVVSTPLMPQPGSWSMGRAREFFDQALTICLKGLPHARGRPLPVILPDGRAVDLYELSISVNKIGGYDLVSAKQMWVTVAGDLGFGPECGPTLKLIYAKYLKEVVRWLHEVGGAKNLDCDSVYGMGIKDSPIVIVDSHEESPMLIMDSQEESPTFITDGKEEPPNLIRDSKETSAGILGTPNGKRKREQYFSGLLMWIKRVAINPWGYIEQNARISGQSEQWLLEKKRFIQAMTARTVLFHPNQQSLYRENLHAQKKQKVCPSLYEASNSANNQALDRLRATDKRLALYGSQYQPFVSPSSLAGNHTVGLSVSVNPTGSDTQWLQCIPRPSSDAFDGIAGSTSLHLERMTRKRIPIGPNNQAIVPDWHGAENSGNGDTISVEVDLDESRWLAMQVWPPKVGKSVVNKDRIGKGRPDGCRCSVPGSIECVRSHIREERNKLKAELGSAFFTWRFDDMGEDASTSWTPEEERKFRALVRLNPVSLEKNFWNHLSACFPSKSMEMLVSYYFNVFVLRRRTLQNRVKPEEIDSDDDESEFGSVENFNMDGLVLSGMKNAQQFSKKNYLGETSCNLICQQNMQDYNFDVLEERDYSIIATHTAGKVATGIQNEHGMSCLNQNIAERGAKQEGT